MAKQKVLGHPAYQSKIKSVQHGVQALQWSMKIFGLEVTNYDGDGFIDGVGHHITYYNSIQTGIWPQNQHYLHLN